MRPAGRTPVDTQRDAPRPIERLAPQLHNHEVIVYAVPVAQSTTACSLEAEPRVVAWLPEHDHRIVGCFSAGLQSRTDETRADALPLVLRQNSDGANPITRMLDPPLAISTGEDNTWPTTPPDGPSTTATSDTGAAPATWSDSTKRASSSRPSNASRRISRTAWASVEPKGRVFTRAIAPRRSKKHEL